MDFEKIPTQEIKKEKEFTREQIETVEDIPITPFEKVELILVRKGFKMATDIELTGDVWKIQEENPKQIDRAKLKKVEKSLKKAGYAYKTNYPEIEEIVSVEEGIPEEEIRAEHESVEEKREKITITIAEDQKDLDEYLEIVKSGSDKNMGKAYGFPKSAVKSYSKSDDNNSGLIGRKDLPEEIRKQEWSLFASFMMSKDKLKKELEIVKKWAEIVSKTSPKIYREYVEYMKEVVDY